MATNPRRPVERDQVSLTPPEATAEPAGVSLTPQPGSNLPTETISRRAEVYGYALGQSPDKVYNDIQSGREASLRQAAAAQRDLQVESNRLQMMQEFAKSLEGRQPTEEEYEFFAGLSYKQLADPNTIIEEQLSRQTINDLYGPTGTIDRAMEADPDTADDLMTVAERTMTARQIAQVMLEDLGQNLSDKPFLAKAEQYTNYFVTGALPFLRQWAYHNAIKPPFPTSFWQGDNTLAQHTYLYRLAARDPSEFYRVLKAGIDDIASKNLPLAQEYLQSFIQYGSTSAWLDTAINVADLSVLAAPAVRLAGGAAKTIKSGVMGPQASRQAIADSERFAEALKAGVRAVDPAKPDVKEVMAAAGNSTGSAVARFFEAMKGQFFAQDPARLSEDLLSSLPAFMDPGKFFRGAFKLTRQYADDIIERSRWETGALLKTMAETRNASSISPSGLQEAFERGRKALQLEASRGGFDNAVIDIDRIVLPEMTPSNVGLNVMRLGKQDRTFFENRHQANYWMKEYGLKGKDAQVRSSGDGYFIQIVRPVDETADDVKNFLVSTDNQTPQSWFTTFLDNWGLTKARTAAERLSVEQRGIRSIMTRGNQQFGRAAQLVGRPLLDLTKPQRLRLNRFLDAQRRFEDVLPDGTRVKGMEFNTLGELERMWDKMFGRLPSAAEVQGYLTYQKLNQYDYVVRNLNLYHWKARQGIRQWQVGKGKPWIEGKLEKQINWDNLEGTIVKIDPVTGETKTYIKGKTSEKLRAQLDDLIANQGYQLINNGVNPFTGDAPVNFYLTKTANSKNLGWKQFEYRGGGHIKYDYPFFIKQGKLTIGADGTKYFTGDNTVLPVTIGRQAKEYVKSLEVAREIYRSGGDYATFKAAVEAKLPVDPELLWNRFKNGTLDKDTPFVDVRSGQSSTTSPTMQAHLQTGYSSWNDSPLNLMKGADLEFVGRRGWDSFGARHLADEDAPLWGGVATSRMIDPLPMIATAIQRVNRNRMLQPYQLRSAEHFVEEFHPALASRPGEGLAEKLARLRSNPLSVMANAVFDPNADRNLLAAARSYQHAAQNLIGTSTEFQAWNRWMQTKLIDSIYSRAGAAKAEFVYEHLWAIPDPIKFARQVAFHTKLGLFNPVQLWLQYQTFTNIIALSPKHAGPGLFGAYLMRALEVGGQGASGLARDGSHAKHFAKIATKLGWKEDEFLEAYDFMRRSGVFHIGPAHAYRSDALDPELFKGKAGQWFDKGLIFFNEGERGNLLAGFATAYREWRRANPHEPLTRAAEGRIMSRFEDLTVNMSHADASMLNRGLGAVSGQFFSYQTRLMELMTGKRLTWQEKLRAFTVYSAMYGIPAGVAAFTTGAHRLLPFYEDVHVAYVKNGKEPDNALINGMLNGIPSLILEAALGEQFNIGDRLGPNGLELWKNIASGDATVQEILAGASGSIAGDILQSTQPLLMQAYQYISGDPKVAPEVTVTDMIEALRNVSSLNNATKAYNAIVLGKWITAGQVTIDNEVTPLEGIMTAVFGLTPERIMDIEYMEQAMKGKQQSQQFARTQAKKYWGLGWREENPETREAYFHQARVWLLWGDFTLQERGEITAEAISDYETKSQKTRRRFENQFPNAGQEAQ